MSSGFGQELDAQTLERARRGDARALESIYRLYSRACYTLALRILGEPGAAECGRTCSCACCRCCADSAAKHRLPGLRLTANATIADPAQLPPPEDDARRSSSRQRARRRRARDAWALLQRLPYAPARCCCCTRSRATRTGTRGPVRTERELFEIDPRACAEALEGMLVATSRAGIGGGRWQCMNPRCRPGRSVVAIAAGVRTRRRGPVAHPPSPPAAAAAPRGRQVGAGNT